MLFLNELLASLDNYALVRARNLLTCEVVSRSVCGSVGCDSADAGS